MSGITADELAAMRADAEEYLPDTCTIERDASVWVSGKRSAAWAVRASGVPCRVTIPSIENVMRLDADQLQEGRYWVFSMKWDQVVLVTDRILFNGHTYQPVWVNDDETEPMLRRVAARRTN